MQSSTNTRATWRLGLELGQLEAGVLEIDDRLAERLAFLDVGDGVLHRRLDGGDRLDGDDQPLLRQLLHELDEAHAGAAQQIVGRHADIVEEQLRRVLRLHADLLEIAAALEALGRRLDGDQRRALGAELGVGLGDHDHQVGELAVADEGLRAVDHPVIAVHHRAGLDRTCRSEPVPGSVMAMALMSSPPTIGSQRCFCSSVP